MSALLSRGVEPRLRGLLAQHPVVVVEGARAVGKTTLAQTLLDDGTLTGRYVVMDRELDIARADPDGWLASLPNGSVIDEKHSCYPVCCPQ